MSNLRRSREDLTLRYYVRIKAVDLLTPVPCQRELIVTRATTTCPKQVELYLVQEVVFYFQPCVVVRRF